MAIIPFKIDNALNNQSKIIPFNVEKKTIGEKIIEGAAKYQEAIGGTGATLGERVGGVLGKIGGGIQSIIANLAPTKTIANIQGGMPVGEAIKKAYTDLPREVQIATEKEQVKQKAIAEGKTEEEATKLAQLPYSTPTEQREVSSAMGYVVGGAVNIQENLVESLIKTKTIQQVKALIPQVSDDAASLLAKTTDRKIISGLLEKFNIKPITDIYTQATKGVITPAEKLAPKAILKPAIPESIPKIPQITPPQLSQKVPQISKELTSIEKITQVLKESKPIRGTQEAIYTAERAKKMARALAVGEKATGEAGFYKELGQLKGEMPKVQFEALRGKIGQADVDNLFSQVKSSKLLSFWDSISARKGLSKVLEGRVPTEGELILLDRVFPKEFVKAVLDKRGLFAKFADAGYQLANIPRSVMASFDLSAPFRQGLFLISHPKRFFGSFVDMFKAFGSEKSFKAIQENIVKKPTFNLMKESKLALTEMGSILTKREESFMSGWAEKIPIVGKVIRASGRAYTGFLNKLRADVFDDLITQADKLGLTPRNNPDLVKEISNFVNVASGRGSIGALQPAANALNSFFFSPRLMASRLTLLNPVYYIKANPFVRKEALKSLFTVLGAGTTILGLSKLAGADVGTDPRSADFGKIIIGKTRIDIWGGLQQYIRMFGQVISGQYVSSTTGKLMTLGEGYKPLTRYEIIQRQIEGKEAPIFSLITTLLKGQTFTGEKASIPKEIGQRLIPMAISDIYEVYKNEPELLPLSGLGLFGFGLQTYSDEKRTLPTEKEKKQTYEISKILGEQAREKEALNNASELMYAELKKIPKEQAKEEFNRIIKENPEMAEKINDIIKDEQLGLTFVEKMMKQLGVENGQRAEYIVEALNKLSKEEKKSYFQNLVDKKVITKQVNEQILELLKK